MAKVEGSFTTPDGLKIYTANFLPSGTPKAIMIIVHGIGEHSGRYEHVAQYFVDQQFAIYTLDHRSHGHSEGEHRTYFDSFDQPVEDLKQYFDQVKSLHPDLPVFIYSHSMGSFISLLFMYKYQQLLQGWVCCGIPLTLDDELPSFLIQFGKLMSKIAPLMRFNPYSDLHILSRDPAVIAAAEADPLMDKKPTRFGMSAGIILGGMEARQHLDQITLPTLVIHGGGDTFTPVTAAHMVYDRISSSDKAIKIYEGLYHEIHNEPEKDQVFADVLSWLNDHL